MGLGLIPMIMSVAIAIVCGIAALVGGLLLLDEGTRPLGRRILRCSAMALVTGVFFAWAGLFFLADAILLLWAIGPVGVLIVVGWHCWDALKRPTKFLQESPKDPGWGKTQR
jgi:hypothetical protein